MTPLFYWETSQEGVEFVELARRVISKFWAISQRISLHELCINSIFENQYVTFDKHMAKQITKPNTWAGIRNK